MYAKFSCFCPIDFTSVEKLSTKLILQKGGSQGEIEPPVELDIDGPEEPGDSFHLVKQVVT